MTPLSVPQNPEDITPLWLEQALSESFGAGLPGIVSLDTETVGAGRGHMGRILRLKPKYRDEHSDAPVSLVAKLPPFNATGREQDRRLFEALFSNEIRWYRDLAERCPIRVPNSYWGGMDRDRGRFCLLLEDVGDLRIQSQLESCSAADARLAVEALARIHATWWADGSLDQLRWLRGADQSGATLAQLWNIGWQPFQEFMADDLPPGFSEIGERVGAQMVALHERAAASAGTLVHGDYRLENFLFDDNAEVESLCVLDCQGVHRGSGPGDLAYFIGLSLTTELRREREDDLLHLYHETLRRNGVADYGFQQCYDDYRIGLLVALAIPVNGARSFLESRPTDARENLADQARVASMKVIARRNVDAILESDAQAMLEL